MSYKIVVSAQQLRVIQAALEVCPALDDTDEYGSNVQEVLSYCIHTTLECKEDDTTHAWIA